jgi:hypothetical protein
MNQIRKGFTIIDCPVDASENLRLTQRLGTLAAPT